MFFNTPKTNLSPPEAPGLDVKINLRLSQDSMIKLLWVLAPLILGGVGGAASIQWWKAQSPPLHSQPAPPAEAAQSQK